MPRTFADEIVETSQTVGTGTYDLDGAKGSYRAFRQGYSTADAPSYYVRNAKNTKWEKNRGGVLTVGTPDRLSRSVVLSTNGNAPVVWGTARPAADGLCAARFGCRRGCRHRLVWRCPACPAALRRALVEHGRGRRGLLDRHLRRRRGRHPPRDLRRGQEALLRRTADVPRSPWAPRTRSSPRPMSAARSPSAPPAGARTATLPASATAKDGYHLELQGLSTANGIVLTPDAGDGIDGGADGATKTVPGGILFTVRWSNADDRWITSYRGAGGDGLSGRHDYGPGLFQQRHRRDERHRHRGRRLHGRHRGLLDGALGTHEAPRRRMGGRDQPGRP